MSREPNITDGDEARRIALLSAEISHISAELARLAGDPAELQPSGLTAANVRAIIRGRRLRTSFLPPSIFEDPAWDMILDLMAARLAGERVAVSSLCIAASVPPTTALRWIRSLCDMGLFARVADPDDGRRVFIELTDKTAAATEAYLTTVQRIAPLTV
jgi:hypothetical protein